MPIVVVAMEPEKYREWAEKQKAKYAAPAAEAAAPAEKAADAKVAAGPVDGKKVYEGLCQACHMAGVANAPKTGDKVAWGPRIKQGIDTLHQHAVKGYNLMPAKGGNPALSDAEVHAAVDYIVAQTK